MIQNNKDLLVLLFGGLCRLVLPWQYNSAATGLSSQWAYIVLIHWIYLIVEYTTPWRSTEYGGQCTDDGRGWLTSIIFPNSHFRLHRNHVVSFGRNRKRIIAAVSETNTNTKPLKTPVSAPKTKPKTKFGRSLQTLLTFSFLQLSSFINANEHL
jgi:hypothetical protein